MNHYELLYIVPATYSEDELPPLTQKVKNVVTKHGGQINIENNLGKKKLAYPIKNYRQAYYLIVEFDAEPAQINAMENELRLSGDVLRHMIVIKNPTKVKTSTRTELGTDKLESTTSPEVPRKTTNEDEKVRLDDLDKKLDEILEGKII